MAKLEVVSSAPKTRTTHWLLSGDAALVSNRAARAAAPFPAVFATHGVVLSDQRTPPSLASCSKVTGTNEPTTAISYPALQNRLALNTNSTYCKYLSGEAICVKSSQLEVCRWGQIFTLVSGSASTTLRPRSHSIFHQSNRFLNIFFKTVPLISWSNMRMKRGCAFFLGTKLVSSSEGQD
jgi:hypothetical protein